MKKEIKYALGLAALFALLIIMEYNKPKPLDWSHSYSSDKKAPFGTYALFKLLPSYFKNSSISISRKTIFETESTYADSNFTYVFIGDEFYPSKEDLTALKRILRKGNDVFIAASYFSAEAEDSLRIFTKDISYTNIVPNPDSVISKLQDSVTLNFNRTFVKSSNKYKLSGNHAFAAFDSLSKYPGIKVLGTFKSGEPFMVCGYEGSGRLFLSTVPLAFTNYYFVRDAGKGFVENSFSFLKPNRSILWDAYYNGNVVVSKNPLRYVLGNDALRYSLYLTMAALILFLFFEGKRKQRIIPIIEPLPNNSLDFVKTISSLYLSKGNHKNIADKKIIYFFDYVKKHYFLHFTDQDFKDRLIAKSGVDEVRINQLIRYIDNVKLKSSIGEDELMNLNKLIEDFLKDCK